MKKNDKVIILLIIGIVCTLLTWFVECGSYQDGLFVSNGILRAGIFDYMLIVYYALYYKASTIFFLFVLGGFYGIVSKTKGYRKLVSKAVKLIRNREIPALLITTFVVGLWTSFTNEILAALIVVPFIITVFLKRGKDRLTALSAGFGGIFIGFFGMTLGTYGIRELLSLMSLTVRDGIGFKIAMFILTYGLYNLFAIIHMRNQEDVVNHTKYDMFMTEKLDETEVKKNKRQKVWPTVLILSLVAVIGVIAYINWNDSFNVTLFDNVMTKIENVKVDEIPIIQNILGSFNAFGKWTDLLPLSFVLIVASIIIAIVNKVSIGDAFSNFGEGAKKISKVVGIYMLVMAIFVISYYFPWPVTLINAIFGNGKFSLFSILLAAILAGIFFVDSEYLGYIFGTYLAANFADHLVATSLLMHFGYAISMVLAPTSFVLMMALSYLDIPYKNWLKYIWKFALAILVVIILLVAIIVYV